jgi:hypothetical protein
MCVCDFILPLNRRDSHKDHDPTHGNRPNDTPGQGAGLVLEGHLEVFKEHDEDEDVVDGQGFFDEVAGEEFHGGLFA